MKASVLYYVKLNFVFVVYMLKGFKKCNLKKVNLENSKSCGVKKMSKKDKLLEKEDHNYVPGRI